MNSKDLLTQKPTTENAREWIIENFFGDKLPQIKLKPGEELTIAMQAAFRDVLRVIEDENTQNRFMIWGMRSGVLSRSIPTAPRQTL